MKQIKFRAWDAERQEMYGEGHGMMYGQQEEMDDSLLIRFKHFEGEPIFMQYTGLQDRKGQDIYEGDILTSEQYPFQDEGKYNYHGVIEWIEEEASFYMTKRLANKEKRGMSDGISQPIEEIEEFEIIGNIYEHPHLLEVESK